MKYQIKANRTAADVLKNNDITIVRDLTLDDAWRVSISIQKTGAYAAVWIEEEEAPRIERGIEYDVRSHVRIVAVRVDNWLV